jgi:subtilisin-like proprotein convertase family protein
MRDAMKRLIPTTCCILLVLGCASIQEEPDMIVDDPPIDLGGEADVDPGWDPPVDPATETADDPGSETADDPVSEPADDPVEDPVTEVPADVGGDPDADPATDPGTGWGVAVCGSGTTIPDRGSYTDSVTIPALGRVLVMQLDIVIADRALFGIEIPFDDLQVALTSPYSGMSRTFWKNFNSDDAGGMLPDYGFPVTWEIPVWWDTPVGGTWTLDIRDTELTLRTTTLTSWCLTPLDPSLHSSTPIHSTMRLCATDTGRIPDCDLTSSPTVCPGEGVFEMQVTDIVHQDTGAPSLELAHTHPRSQELTVILVSANGYEHTLWDRATGSMPSSFSLTGMTGEWITGRYQLRVQDHEETRSGSVTSWCLAVN